MQRRILMLIAAAGLAAFAAADRVAHAQQSADPAEPAATSSAPAAAGRQPEVIITGDRAQFASRISTFVDHITDFDAGDSTRGLARWQDKLCPLVTGLPRGMAEYILLRISDVAREVGVPLAGEKCHTTNLFIIVTKHPDTYLRDLQKEHGSDVFGGATPMLINEFITTPRPVRPWYDTVEQTPEGLPLVAQSFPGISQQHVIGVLGGVIVLPVRPAISDTPLTNAWSQASHLVLNAVWAIKRVYLIVDPTRFKGVKLGQLADYLTMAGLAQIKLDPQLGDAPTILTLFDKPPEQTGMGLTDWDMNFLRAFYSSEQKSVVQRSAISRDMVSRMAH